MGSNLGKIDSVLLEWVTGSDQVHEITNELFNSSDDPPVFYSSGMLKTYESVTGQNVTLVVGKVDKQVLMALPIEKHEFWQNISYPGWDNLAPLVSRQCSPTSQSQFWLKLMEEVNLLKLTEWTSSYTLFNDIVGIQTAQVDRRKCPFIPLEDNWEMMNERLGKKLVRNIRQYGNKASAKGISFKTFKAIEISLDERLALLESAFGFHSKRMVDIHQDSKFTMDVDYHQAVMKNPENIFMITANDGEDLIACYYGFFNDTRLAWFNGGYSQDYYKYSIGTLLVAELISFAQREKLSVFDFLRGNESYKQKWTTLFDRNRDVYLAKKGLSNTLKLKYAMFGDLRKRIGSKAALNQVISNQFN